MMYTQGDPFKYLQSTLIISKSCNFFENIRYLYIILFSSKNNIFNKKIFYCTIMNY